MFRSHIAFNELILSMGSIYGQERALQHGLCGQRFGLPMNS